MLQMMTTMNLSQNERGKSCFTTVQHMGKIAFLDKTCSNVQDMLEYLQSIWNAGDVKELISFLSSEMRKKYFDSGEKLVDVKLKMDSLLIQQKRLLWSDSEDDKVYGVVALVILDRKMRRWLLSIYGIAQRKEDKLLLEEYHLLDVRKLSPKEELDKIELAVIKHKEKTDKLKDCLEKLGYSRKENENNETPVLYEKIKDDIKASVEEKHLIICTQDKEKLKENIKELIQQLKAEEVRASLKDGIIRLEEV